MDLGMYMHMCLSLMFVFFYILKKVPLFSQSKLSSGQ
jgi:hypothetical protein